MSKRYALTVFLVLLAMPIRPILAQEEPSTVQVDRARQATPEKQNTDRPASRKRGDGVIAHIQVSGVGQRVQVRIVGSDLSCTPFRLGDPDRLVLDCPRAQVQVQRTPIRVDLDPIRAVRVGQFKADAARVVIDLEGNAPYTIQADRNTVTIVFDSMHRQASRMGSMNDSGGVAPRPVKTEGEQSSSANALVLPDKVPLLSDWVGSSDAVSTARLPSIQFASLPLEPSPVPAQSSDLTGVRQPDSEVGTPAERNALVVPDKLPNDGVRSSDAASTADQLPSIQFAYLLEPAPDPAQSSDLTGVRKPASEAGAPAERLDSTSVDQDYVIGPQDLLAINVWHEPELSRSVPVRPDGKISLPLVGELQVSGLTARLLETRIAEDLKDYILKPQVTVIIQEVHSYKFYIIGMVERPGAYPLTASTTVLDALAAAGGFRDFAKVRKIYLLRLMPDNSRKRLKVDFKAAVNGKKSYHDIKLQTGDTIVVP